jgi:ABC-type Fe3+ transport system substrate-binding protein
MSEFETARNMKTIVCAVVVIAIVGVSAIAYVMLGGLTPPTTTTTDTTTTTTTTTTPLEGALTILTRHDVMIHNVFEPAFLATDFAVTNGINDIIWKTPTEDYWDDLIQLGQVDVCWGGGPTLFDQLMIEDYLEVLDSPLMVEVASRINSTIAGAVMKRNNSAGDLVWIAAAISSFGFTVNHDFLDTYSLPTPMSWTDLADPIYGSLLKAIPTIAMGNAPDTTSNTRIYEIITQGMGWDTGWVTMARMAGSANIYGGSVETQNAAETGQVGISMSIDFYGYGTQYRNPDCEYILPEGESIVNGDPIAISSTSSHKDLAEGFLDFVLSSYGQSLWLSSSINRMPVMREAFDEPLGIAAPQLYVNYNQTIANVGIYFDDAISLGSKISFIHYFEAVFTDAHTELVDCWDAILKAYTRGTNPISLTELNDLATLMGATVTVADPNTAVMEKFTLAYATEINGDMYSSASFLSAIKTAWTAAAKAQYISVMASVPAP